MANTTINFKTVEGIRAYAQSRYDEGGWIFVDDMFPEDIEELIETSENGRVVRQKVCQMMKDARKEIIGQIDLREFGVA